MLVLLETRREQRSREEGVAREEEEGRTREEEERRKVVEEERRRMLQQNVDRLVGHIPKGVLTEVGHNET